MPTHNRRQFIRNKVRVEFRNARNASDPDEVRELIIFAQDRFSHPVLFSNTLNFSLENVRAQQKHLNKRMVYPEE